ncbi:MAG: DUF3078 domain-containing protein [Muribaculaceae bacterium]
MKRILLVFLLLGIALSAQAVKNDSTQVAPCDTVALDSTIVLIPTPVLADSTTYIPSWTEIEPNIMFSPIVFDKQQTVSCGLDTPRYGAPEKASLDLDREWLDRSMHKSNFEKYHINRVIYTSPNVVGYIFSQLPEPPKTYVIKSEPNKVTLTLEELTQASPTQISINNDVKVKNWIHTFQATAQFSQAYLSGNWYQSGNSNLNILTNLNYTVKLNPNVHPDLLFENYFNYKLSMNNAPQDSLRNYSISEDLLQINSKFGIKAAKKWYYSATAQFKTQLLKNYKSNTYDLKASFLSAAELNVGLGMTYNTANKKKNLSFNLSLSPVSYNLKLCRDIDNVDPTAYGIEAGKHTASEIGSNIEGRLTWDITPNISWSSRIYTFTDYDYLQGDWENTLNFSINKFLSTQIFLHLRYDSSKESHPDWKKWQFKEILSFGFNYKI